MFGFCPCGKECLASDASKNKKYHGDEKARSWEIQCGYGKVDLSNACHRFLRCEEDSAKMGKSLSRQASCLSVLVAGKIKLRQHISPPSKKLHLEASAQIAPRTLLQRSKCSYNKTKTEPTVHCQLGSQQNHLPADTAPSQADKEKAALEASPSFFFFLWKG